MTAIPAFLASVLTRISELAMIALAGTALGLLPVALEPRGFNLAGAIAFGWAMTAGFGAVVAWIVRLVLMRFHRTTAVTGALLGWASIAAGAGAVIAGQSGIADRAAYRATGGFATSAPEVAVVLGAVAVVAGIWVVSAPRREARSGRAAALLGIGATLVLGVETLAFENLSGVTGRLLPVAAITAVLAFAGLLHAEYAARPGLRAPGHDASTSPGSEG